LFVEKLFRTAQNKISQMRTKQTERREKKISKQLYADYGDFYRV
jgi:hypothetical protein